MLFKAFFGGNRSRARGRENPETQIVGEFALHFKGRSLGLHLWAVPRTGSGAGGVVLKKKTILKKIGNCGFEGKLYLQKS